MERELSGGLLQAALPTCVPQGGDRVGNPIVHFEVMRRDAAALRAFYR